MVLKVSNFLPSDTNYARLRDLYKEISTTIVYLFFSKVQLIYWQNESIGIFFNFNIFENFLGLQFDHIYNFHN